MNKAFYFHDRSNENKNEIILFSVNIVKFNASFLLMVLNKNPNHKHLYVKLFVNLNISL